MAKIFITGSTDGLGQLTANALKQGHQVVLHARNSERGKRALEQTPGAEDVLIADFANALSTFDTVIHNADVYQAPKTAFDMEGLPVLFTMNSLAPYMLTAMMHKPERLIYMSSGMHLRGNVNFDNLLAGIHNGFGHVAYSDTHNCMI